MAARVGSGWLSVSLDRKASRSCCDAIIGHLNGVTYVDYPRDTKPQQCLEVRTGTRIAHYRRIGYHRPTYLLPIQPLIFDAVRKALPPICDQERFDVGTLATRLWTRGFPTFRTPGADNRLIAVAPLLLRRIPVIGGLELRAIEFFGADSLITELRGVVCEQADQPAVVKVLRNYLRAKGVDWDLFRWQGIRTNVLQALDGSAPPLVAP